MDFNNKDIEETTTKNAEKPLAAIEPENPEHPVDSVAPSSSFKEKFADWWALHKPISRLDRYIILKFLGTYFFSIALIMSISVVFDFNENIDKFLAKNAPWKAIWLDYYLNFIPYYSNLFSQLFVFIAVIFFTTKLADNSEIIAMMSTGVSFKRLMKPYMISAAVIALLTFVLGAYVIPKGNVKRVKFENTYKRKRVTTFATNVQLEVDTGVVALIQRYEDRNKMGCLKRRLFLPARQVQKQGADLATPRLDHTIRHTVGNSIPLDPAQLHYPRFRRHARGHYTRYTNRLHYQNGTLRLPDHEGTAGDDDFPRLERIHREAETTWFRRHQGFRSGVLQTRRLVVRGLHPYRHRSVTLRQTTQERHGYRPRNRTDTDLCLHPLPDHISLLRHQLKCATYIGGLDSKHRVYHHRLLFLQKGAKIRGTSAYFPFTASFNIKGHKNKEQYEFLRIALS